MGRKLATIQKISWKKCIEGADNIELVGIKGWQCVVRKEMDFKVNDFVVYFEIDSILPLREEFKFLTSYYSKRYNGYRLRTVKLLGQISQGLIMPISLMGNLIYEKKEEFDLTSILNVKKYIEKIPTCLEGEVKGSFPDFIPKTNEERIQNIPEVLKKFKDLKVFLTEKLDGTSTTFYFKDGVFGVCGRGWEYEEGIKNAYWQVASTLKIKEIFESLNINIALQGETIGPGIQKNRYNLNSLEFRVFNIFDIDKKKFYNLYSFKDMCKYMNLKSVPLIEETNLNNDIKYWIKKSIGKSKLNKNIQREGIVVRSTYNLNFPNGKFSFKAINPNFLIEHRK